MVDPKDFAQYLVSNEDVLYAAGPITVNGDSGYEGAVTNKRIIFLKGRKLHEFLGSSISLMNWESSRRIGMIIAGILLFIVGLLVLRSPPVALGGGIMILGLTLFLVGVLFKKENFRISGAGRDMKLTGSKNYLESIMITARNELLK